MKLFKSNEFKIIWRYLKDDKTRLFIYISLLVITLLSSVVTPYFWGNTLEQLIDFNLSGFFKWFGIWCGATILFSVILKYPLNNIYLSLEKKFAGSVVRDLYKKINCLPATAFENIGVGEFTNRLYNDPDKIIELLSSFVRGIINLVVCILLITVISNISIILGLEIIIFAAAIYLVTAYFLPKIEKKQEEKKDAADILFKDSTENISGIREVKSLGIKGHLENINLLKIDKFATFNKEIQSFECNFYLIYTFLYVLCEAMIFLTAGYYYCMGTISFATFAVIESYMWRIDSSMSNLSELGVSYSKIKVSLKRIGEILDNELYDDEVFGTKKIKNPKGEIEFKNVSFKYSKDEPYTLNDMCVKFETKKKNAIVGRSGNGKSTVFNLLVRYFDATSGDVLIDGVNIKELSEDELRANVSIIRQSPFLFNISIIDNLKIVKPSATLNEIEKACKDAYIYDYIKSLPTGFDTIIGEGGVNLSGGQKQRLAIARTLLLNTKIILFDEATSALDNEAQSYIKKSIDKLAETHTVLIVAHRLSTILDADNIFVVENGSISASGSHAELIENNDHYMTLYSTESLIE